MLDPIQKMWERVERERPNSATTLYSDLMLLGEMLVKLVGGTLTCAIRGDSADYKQDRLNQLVRSNGLAAWAETIRKLAGNQNDLLPVALNQEKIELGQTSASSDWQYEAVSSLIQCLNAAGVSTAASPQQIKGYSWFGHFALLRNETKGHGADTIEVHKAICPHLERSLRALIDNFSLFVRPWFYLYRTPQGQYQINPLTPQAMESLPTLEPLLTVDDDALPRLRDGVYVYIGSMSEGGIAVNGGHEDVAREVIRATLSSLVRVETIVSDPTGADYLFPNGGFSTSMPAFDLLSYITGDKKVADGKPYTIPTGGIASETEGLGQLVVKGETLTNIPPCPHSYVKRQGLEQEFERVVRDDYTSIITLAGRGGIGKTSLTLCVLHRITTVQGFDVIVWFSARDIDLLQEGPRPVRQKVTTKGQMAGEYVRLTDSTERARGLGIADMEMMERAMRNSEFNGRTLFVFDNFETVSDPRETFEWIRANVRLPNKAVITTRHGVFKGDYPIEVEGMTPPESRQLVDETSHALRVMHLVNAEYKGKVVTESEGHPYVIKILLGEVAKKGSRVHIGRLFAGREDILEALFERTYDDLSEHAKLIFLTLCSRRSIVPHPILEAVMLSPGNERFNLDGTLRELRQRSLIEEMEVKEPPDSQNRGQTYCYYSVPVSARLFGQNMRPLSAFGHQAEQNGELLALFGMYRPTDVAVGMEPVVDTVLDNVTRQFDGDEDVRDTYIGLLRSIAPKFPKVWLDVATLCSRMAPPEGLSNAQRALNQCLMMARAEDVVTRRDAWQRLEHFASTKGDLRGSINALAGLCKEQFMPLQEVRTDVMRLHRAVTHPRIKPTERKAILEPVIRVLDTRRTQFDAADYHRAALLCVDIRDDKRVRRYVTDGLRKDRRHPDLLNMASRYNIPIPRD